MGFRTLSHSAASNASSLGALAALGSLRECLASAQNLEHLISSRSVGPRVLTQVVPDVATTLSTWPTLLESIVQQVTRPLTISPEEAAQLTSSACEETSALVDALKETAGGAMHAKQRLSVEQQLRSAMPLITATAHLLELLVESATSQGVPMSIEELLTSTPRKGSDRPHLRILVSGPIRDLWVAIPARIGLRTLGALAQLQEKSPGLGLDLAQEGESAVLTFRAQQTSGTPVQLPILQATQATETTVRASLRAFGGSLLNESRGLRLPLCTPDGLARIP